MLLLRSLHPLLLQTMLEELVLARDKQYNHTNNPYIQVQVTADEIVCRPVLVRVPL